MERFLLPVRRVTLKVGQDLVLRRLPEPPSEDLPHIRSIGVARKETTN